MCRLTEPELILPKLEPYLEAEPPPPPSTLRLSARRPPPPPPRQPMVAACLGMRCFVEPEPPRRPPPRFPVVGSADGLLDRREMSGFAKRSKQAASRRLLRVSVGELAAALPPAPTPDFAEVEGNSVHGATLAGFGARPCDEAAVDDTDDPMRGAEAEPGPERGDASCAAGNIRGAVGREAPGPPGLLPGLPAEPVAAAVDEEADKPCLELALAAAASPTPLRPVRRACMRAAEARRRTSARVSNWPRSLASSSWT